MSCAVSKRVKLDDKRRAKGGRAGLSTRNAQPNSKRHRPDYYSTSSCAEPKTPVLRRFQRAGKRPGNKHEKVKSTHPQTYTYNYMPTFMPDTLVSTLKVIFLDSDHREKSFSCDFHAMQWTQTLLTRSAQRVVRHASLSLSLSSTTKRSVSTSIINSRQLYHRGNQSPKLH